MNKRPIIGVTGGYSQENNQTTIGNRYFESVINAGGLPVLLPITKDEAVMDAILDSIDALLLSGGGDIDPAIYGEEKHPACGMIEEKRDAFELPLTRKALERRMPIFGICRGFQVLAVALGATLFQDIESQLGIPKENHKQEKPYDNPVHTVRFKEGGLFERITGTPLMPTNSMHHQAVKEAGDRIRIEGITMDGVIEAISAADNDAVIGAEFHPEFLAHYSDWAARLFDYFVECASAKQE